MLEGSLVPADQIDATWQALTATFKSHMLAIPSKVAARIGMCKTTVERQELLRLEVHHALDQLSKVAVVVADDKASEAVPGEAVAPR